MKRMMSLSLGLLLVGLVLCAMPMYAVPVTFVEQGAEWQYDIFDQPDLWIGWNAAGYNSFDWGSAEWETGSAAFGNTQNYNGSGLYYTTPWAAGTDLALRTSFTLEGPLTGDATLNVASDNGFMVFINGALVAKENAEGFTNYWEYSLSIAPSFFGIGENIISVLAEDHGGITFFDMELTGDVVPEPGTILLLGVGLLVLVGLKRKINK